MKKRINLINSIADKRLELQELYEYLYVEELECGRTRFDVFSTDEIDLLDDHEDYLMAVMDVDLAEKELGSLKKMYEAQLRNKK